MAIFGVIVTFIYISIITLLRWSDFSELKTIPLNELGDFLAGVFGPLTLFWLILGYIQQQKELRQNTKAIELQADELRRSVEQHKELVKATQEQVKADLKALEIEEIRSKREASPNFSITSAGWASKSGKRVSYQISVINSGKPASDVTFVTIPEIKEIASFRTVHYFSEGQIVKITWDNQVSGETPNKLRLLINCKDANACSLTKVFDMNLDSDGKYNIEHIAELN